MKLAIDKFEIRDSKLNFELGFTLLEVVVAMAIVGLGVVTLLELFSLNLRLGARSAERTEATAYGRQRMDEVLIRRDIKEGKEIQSSERNGRWSLTVEPSQEKLDSLSVSQWDLEEITLDWVYGDGNGKRGVQKQMKTLRLLRKKRS
ncbi:MAG: prepilin-type N-terminal cleavage/methylation domain-containing protein [Candidatus Binatia bacterium]